MLLAKLTDKVRGNTTTDVAIPPDNFIKDMLDAGDSEPIQNRAGTFSGYVHVSSLSKSFCARQYAIAIKENLPLYETVVGGMRVVWAQGRASEDHVRDTMIRKYGLMNFYAKWGCEFSATDHDKNHTYHQRFFKPAKCMCGGDINKLWEPHLYDNNHKVVGRPDLVFRYNNWVHIVECKSIKSEIDSPNKNQHVTFEDITSPIKDHLNQAMFYPDLLKKQEPSFNVSFHVRYVYIAKAFKFGSPYKEFVVDHGTPAYERARRELFEEASQIKDFVETGDLPPRVCPMFGAPMSKACAVAARCFYTYTEND